jgi:hypothetical protein
MKRTRKYRKMVPVKEGAPHPGLLRPDHLHPQRQRRPGAPNNSPSATWGMPSGTGTADPLPGEPGHRRKWSWSSAHPLDVQMTMALLEEIDSSVRWWTHQLSSPVGMEPSDLPPASTSTRSSTSPGEGGAPRRGCWRRSGQGHPHPDVLVIPETLRTPTPRPTASTSPASRATWPSRLCELNGSFSTPSLVERPKPTAGSLVRPGAGDAPPREILEKPVPRGPRSELRIVRSHPAVRASASPGPRGVSDPDILEGILQPTTTRWDGSGTPTG